MGIERQKFGFGRKLLFGYTINGGYIMKNKTAYAYDLKNSCINCTAWHDIGKIQEVQGRNFDDKAIINKVGTCIYNDLSTEKYNCDNYHSKTAITKNNKNYLGLCISLGIIILQVLTALWILSFKQ